MKRPRGYIRTLSQLFLSPALLFAHRSHLSRDGFKDALFGARIGHPRIVEGFESSPEFFFSQDGNFPKYIDSHDRPRLAVQRALGLRELSHHKLGRHSVGGQGVLAGHSLKAIQGQLGHRSPQSTHAYAHIAREATLRLVEDLAPSAPPHVNVRSTSKKKGT